MAILHLMVGLPCSGKTTLARQPEVERSALRLTPDEWQLRLYGQDVHAPEHNARHDLIETLLWGLAASVFLLGTSLILDFGFWARDQREDFLRSRAKKSGAGSKMHFLNVPEDELLRRLAARNAQRPPETFQIRAEMIKPWITRFQAPTPDELEHRD